MTFWLAFISLVMHKNEIIRLIINFNIIKKKLLMYDRNLRLDMTNKFFTNVILVYLETCYIKQDECKASKLLLINRSVYDFL